MHWRSSGGRGGYAVFIAGITEAKGGVSVPALWRAPRLPNPADTQGDIGRTGGILILYRKEPHFKNPPQYIYTHIDVLKAKLPNGRPLPFCPGRWSAAAATAAGASLGILLCSFKRTRAEAPPLSLKNRWPITAGSFSHSRGSAYMSGWWDSDLPRMPCGKWFCPVLRIANASSQARASAAFTVCGVVLSAFFRVKRRL